MPRGQQKTLTASKAPGRLSEATQEKAVYTAPRNCERSDVIKRGAAPAPVPPPHAARQSANGLSARKPCLSDGPLPSTAHLTLRSSIC